MESCAFCNKPKNSVPNLVKGSQPGVAICSLCVETITQILKSPQKSESTQGPKSPRDLKAILDRHVIGQEQAKVDLSVAVYQHFKRREAGPSSGIEKSNVLLLGPSGSGKTEVARTLAKHLSLPFYKGDATKLTQAGYVGDDVESLLHGLIASAKGSVEEAQWGILFLDEVDKIARKSGKASSAHRDVGGEGVQQALLKIVEGSQLLLQKRGRDGWEVFDTSQVLVIMAGSFAGIEEVLAQKRGKGIGFGATVEAPGARSGVYGSITQEDLLTFGVIPELLGRLPVLTTTYPLTEADLYRILTEPENALVKQKKALFKLDGIDLDIPEETLRHWAKEASRQETGARALRGLVEKTLAPLAFEHCGREGVTQVTASISA